MVQAAHKPKPLTDTTDILIDGCRHNDLKCQEQLYRLHYPELIKVCLRYAGDMDGAGIIINNTMLRVFKSIGNYHHEGKLMSWIKTININCCLDYVKQRNTFTNKISATEEVPETSMADSTLDNISAKEIRHIINKLPGATATVFNLYLYENFTHKQIGESLGISEGTSKWHVNEARKRLKELLKEFTTP
jgi:RNA polymerase sigma-70 factor, ECF subfamily